MKIGANWEIDGDGVPWYRGPSTGRRSRGVWRVCQYCGHDFPAPPRNPGLFCSRSCRGRVFGGSQRATRLGLFQHWTPEECWLAGLIWSDGHLGKQRGDNRRIVLRMTDEEVIQEAARIAGCQYRSKPLPAPRKTIHTVQFGERNAVDRIAEAGMDKLKLTERPWPEMPYPASFLRGLFDGDGSVTMYTQKLAKGWPLRLTSHLFGGPVLLAGVQNFLMPYGIRRGTVTQRKNRKTGEPTICYLQWAHYDSLRLAEVMYSDPGPRLERKYVKFAHFMLSAA